MAETMISSHTDVRLGNALETCRLIPGVFPVTTWKKISLVPHAKKQKNLSVCGSN